MKIDWSISAYNQEQRRGLTREEEQAVMRNNRERIQTEKQETQKVAENVQQQSQAITDNAIQQAKNSREASEQANATRENVFVWGEIDTFA